MPEHEILEQAKRIRYDLTALQAKVTELLQMAAKLPEPDDGSQPVCPDCGLKFKGARSLAAHAHQMHDGPVPEHWLEAEQLAAVEPETAEADDDPEPAIGAGT